MVEAGALILLIAIVALAVIAKFLFSGSSAPAVPPPAGTVSELQRVEVRHVIDGDTVIVSKSWSQTRIRLDAIDCPEDGQDWGNISKAGLIKLIGGRCVYLETHGVDEHGRTLATVYLQDSAGSEWINVNERMVMLGHAWVARKYYGHLPKPRQDQLNRLERWARSKRVGLWGTEDPIPPWQWRNQQ
jgi:endonuclease YncB( thermonuclease family)